MVLKAVNIPWFANAGALFENSKFLCILNPFVVRSLLYLLAHFAGRRRHQTGTETFLFIEQPWYTHKHQFRAPIILNYLQLEKKVSLKIFSLKF